MSTPHVWVDADATPREVKEILFRASVKRKIKVTLVANSWMNLPGTSRVSLIQVPDGPDVADDHIADNCVAGELVITADIPLAARVVEKGAEVVRPRGYALDAENVREALSMRDAKEELRDLGVQTGGPRPYSAADRQRFANALDRWVTHALRT